MLKHVMHSIYPEDLPTADYIYLFQKPFFPPLHQTFDGRKIFTVKWMTSNYNNRKRPWSEIKKGTVKLGIKQQKKITLNKSVT